MVRKYVAEFIKYQYKRSDMSMNELTEEFIRDYCLYLKNVVGLAQSSIWIYSIPLKHIVTAAHYNGKIPRNPFAMYHVDPDHKEREFLTLDELTAMTEIKLEDPNMAFARDLFIFGSWTGIAFIDIKNLTEDNITMVNGAPWIVSKRQKTGVPFESNCWIFLCRWLRDTNLSETAITCSTLATLTASTSASKSSGNVWHQETSFISCLPP